MTSTYQRPFGHAARLFIAGLLTASTVAFAQDTVTPPASNGGWKRVNPQTQQQEQTDPNNDQAGDNPAPQYGDPNQPPSAPDQYPPASAPNGYPPTPQGGYPPQGYPQTSSPNGYPQSPGPGGYPPSSGPSGYPQGYPQNPQTNYPPPMQQPGYGSNSRPPAPHAPIPSTLVIQPGTYATVRINQPLSSKANRVGDAFAATLVSPIVVNGVVVAEPGQTIGGRVALAEPSHAGSTGRLGLQLINMTVVDGQVVPLQTQFISRQGGTTPTGQSVGTVAATTGLGAAIGAAAGWGTGAAIGAGAGAVAGLIGVLLTHGHDSVVYPEEVLTFRIEQAVTISTVNSPQAFRYVEPGEYNQQANGPGPAYGPAAGYGPGYQPAPPVYYAGAYGYPYAYPYYGYSPYYWGPSFAFYVGPGYWWGGRYYYGRGYWGGGYYGRGYYGGRYYGGGGATHYASAGGGVHAAGGRR